MSKNLFDLNTIEGRDVEDLPNEFEEDWEEALIEGKEEINEVKTIRPLFNYKKFKWILYFIFIVFILLSYRLFHMQIIAGEEFQIAAEENRYRINIKKPSRGVMYDRNKNMLIRNIPSYDLILTPADLPKNDQEKEELLLYLRDIVEIFDNEYDQALESLQSNNNSTIIFKRNIERDQALQLMIDLNHMPGVNLEINAMREYVYAEEMAHIVGYTGKINNTELERLNSNEYLLNDFIGKNGLEHFYETEMRGKVGKEQVEVDSMGKIKEVVAVNQPEAGKDLMLSIDLELQNEIHQILKNRLSGVKTNRAAVIAMDPNNGEILALVSRPSYDNNLFAQGISEEKYGELLNNEEKPLFNRVISGLYPPGSTIKPVIAVAALEEGVVTPDTIINDTGTIYVPHKHNPDIVYKFVSWDLSGLGPMNIFSAIAKSSDIYFYEVGGGFEELDGLGVNKINEYYHKFNLEEKTGIDIAGEKNGLIPNPEWKEKYKNEQWYLGDTYHMSIGQGDVLSTPLHVALWTATIANGGTIYQPHLVKKIIEKNGNVKEIMPKKIREKFVSVKSVDIVKRAMRETVLTGSAQSLAYLPIASAGKTGTSQHSGSEEDHHAWYTAFAPYENPEIVITALIEEGGEGSKIAVPIVGEILEWYYHNKKQQ